MRRKILWWRKEFDSNGESMFVTTSDTTSHDWPVESVYSDDPFWHLLTISLIYQIRICKCVLVSSAVKVYVLLESCVISLILINKFKINRIITWLHSLYCNAYLATELVARKRQDPQTLAVCQLVVQSLQLLVVLGGEASFTSHVHNQTHVAPAETYTTVVQRA